MSQIGYKVGSINIVFLDAINYERIVEAKADPFDIARRFLLQYDYLPTGSILTKVDLAHTKLLTNYFSTLLDKTIQFKERHQEDKQEDDVIYPQKMLDRFAHYGLDQITNILVGENDNVVICVADSTIKNYYLNGKPLEVNLANILYEKVNDVQILCRLIKRDA